MKTKDPATGNMRQSFIKLTVLVVFVLLMSSTIVYLYESEPDIEAQLMRNYASEFATNVTNSHWQWQAKAQPAMIMLIHYDDNGKEVGRRAVRMTHFGWPKVEPSRAGCEQLWQQMLNIPARIEGFRVLGDYYASDTDTAANARCRFRLSSGPYFDYSIFTGKVTHPDLD